MPYWTFTFFLLTIISAVFAYAGILTAYLFISKVLFFFFLATFLVFFAITFIHKPG